MHTRVGVRCFSCCSVLFFWVRWGRCRSGAADPMKAFGFARIRPARKTWKKFPRRFLRFLFEISQPLTPMETLVFVLFFRFVQLFCHFFSFCIFCFRHVLSRKPYAHQGWRTLFILVLFGFVVRFCFFGSVGAVVGPGPQTL